MGLKYATDKQVNWLADLLTSLGREVTPRALADMRSLRRDEIRAQTERVHKILASRQGAMFPHVIRAYRPTYTQQSAAPKPVNRGGATRAAVVDAVPCSACGASAGTFCVIRAGKQRGEPKRALHHQRWEAFRAQ